MLLKLKFFICFVLLTTALQAQLQYEPNAEKTNIQKKLLLRNAILNQQLTQNSNSPRSIKNSHHTLNYNPAFFCLIEDKIEASSKLPLRFRLGSLQEVDAKEGKGCGFQSRADKAEY